MGTSASGVNGTFRYLRNGHVSLSTAIEQQGTYSLMIKALNLLTENKVLKQGRTALASTKTVLILNGTTNIGGQIDILVFEVECREEFLRVGGSIAVTSALEMRIIDLTGHIRTGSIGNANQARNEGKDMHYEKIKIQEASTSIDLRAEM